jgi:glycosyltransferase involved in cell wall biosynthesis
MKISIITVCFNSEKTIEKTINSIMQQKYKNIEYIVIDGNSTDNTKHIVSKYKKFINKFISEKDTGIYNAINKGIKHATGDLISILHSDDCYFNEDTLGDVVKTFSNNETIECLIGTTIIKRRDGKIIRKYSPVGFKPWMLYLGISPPHPSMFLKKEVYKKYGTYKEHFKIAGDFEFYLRILRKKEINYKIIDESYVVMQDGGISTRSLKSNFISSKEILSSFDVNDIYNNWFIILLRFPYKIMQFIIRK